MAIGISGRFCSRTWRRSEIDRLRVELEKAHKFIDTLSDVVSAVSAENREKILNGIREMAGMDTCGRNMTRR